jgi:hypothetical protein
MVLPISRSVFLPQILRRRSVHFCACAVAPVACAVTAFAKLGPCRKRTCIIPTMVIRERGFSMTNPQLKLVAPSGNIPTVRTPRRGKNAEYRTREHLTEREVERLNRGDVKPPGRDDDPACVPSVTGSGRPKSVTCVGIRSISKRASCTFVGPGGHASDAPLDWP